jgi:DNA-binding response OmpR family regulator
MNIPKLLFVDDEPSIRSTLSAILEQEGFQVTVASTVAEALALINAQNYDVLISDLNIGNPGDGFTVVSAMRRIQPNAVTLILTGFPAFEAALRAIREQVDEFLVKPADTAELVRMIKQRLQQRQPRAPVLTKRLANIIQENQDSLINNWLQRVKSDGELASIAISDTERINHLPAVLNELAQRMEVHRDETSEHARSWAAKHGNTRRQQRYTIPQMLHEARILQNVIAECIQTHLLEVDISNLIPDMIQISDGLHVQTEESVRAYLTTGKQPRAA